MITPGAQPLDDLQLDGQVGLQLLADGLTDPQLEDPLVVGQAFEEEDTVGDLLRVPHLVDRLRARVRRELREAPSSAASWRAGSTG